MFAFLGGLLGLVGVDVGMGFLVLAQRLATRFILVAAAVTAFLFAYNAARLLLENLATFASQQAFSGAAASSLASQVLSWSYCLLPSSTASAVSTLFSAYASMAILHFYWQVLRMKSTGF
jgi:hypothetical protein